MPRRVEIAIAPERTGPLLRGLDGMDGLVGLRVQPGITRQPAGDVVTVDVTDRALPALVRLLAAHDVGTRPGGTFSTSEPMALVSAGHAEALARDTSEATWEEMEAEIAKNSNMTPSGRLVMAIAGVLAAVGIATNALHVVVGAMLVAPGFQPIVRVALGLVAGSGAWRRGVADTVQGYLTLAGAAAATGLLLRATGHSPLGDEASYLPAGVLISYWTSITGLSVLVTTAAALAGALLITTHRAVLTAGVMVGLALVPGATIVALAAVAGDVPAMGRGALRWLLEVALVLGGSTLVLAWKRRRVHRRDALA